MFFAVGSYLGIPFGLLGFQLNRIKTKNLWVALVVALPLSIGFVLTTNFVVRQITKAVDEMVNAGLMG
jgi:Ni,Fe-hydrogenase I cytochrome b subunit